MDYWLGFFRGAGDNIFDAIAVAASDHPAALRSRRDAFAQRLYMVYRRRPAISLLSTTNCFSPKHRWPEDVAWHPHGELIFAMYSADNGDSQVSVMNRSISGQVRTLLEVAHFFTSIASDHAVNKKMIHGTTRKCRRICILLLSWVLLDYSKKNAILSVGSDKRIIPFDLAAGRAGSKISYKIVFLLCPIPTLLKKEG
uniref:Uncharacterized protein n=1 Tax=Oryza barthii TaxID=65489 RepID=A0A0D3H221_9ORYZ